jgi:hypothetical protein
MVRAFVVNPNKQIFILSRRGISTKKIFPKEILWILKGAFADHKFLTSTRRIWRPNAPFVKQ